MGRRGRCLLVFAGRNVRSSSSSSYSSFLPSGETRSITFPGHDTLSLSPFTSPSSGSSTTTPPSLFPLVPLPMMMTIIARDRTREPRHVCAKGIEDGFSFFLFRVSKTMDLGNETRLLYHTFIYYIYYIL